MKSRFARHFLFWLILPVVLIFSAPAIPEMDMFTLSVAEEVANIAMIGPSEHLAAKQRAAERFNRLFVESGLVRSSFRYLTSQGKQQVFELAKNSQGGEAYLSRLWETVFKALYRIEIAMYWVTATFIVIVACLVDGLVRWKVKTYEFGYANPVAFHLASHGLLSVFGLFLVVPWVPFAMQQWIWPLLVIVCGTVSWKAAESFQSGM